MLVLEFPLKNYVMNLKVVPLKRSCSLLGDRGSREEVIFSLFPCLPPQAGLLSGSRGWFVPPPLAQTKSF